LLAACTSDRHLAALDDARVVSVSLATPADVTRLADAIYRERRDRFGGVTINVRGQCPKKCGDYRFNKKVIKIGPREFDTYMYYEDITKMDLLISDVSRELFIVKFEAPFLFVEYLQSSNSHLFPRYCRRTDGGGYRFENESLIWRNRVVSQFTVEEMLAASKTASEPVPFELFLQLPEAGSAADIPDDICVDLIRFSMFSRPRYAQALRISKAALRSAMRQ
jgi:hypothetical protein